MNHRTQNATGHCVWMWKTTMLMFFVLCTWNWNWACQQSMKCLKNNSLFALYLTNWHEIFHEITTSQLHDKAIEVISHSGNWVNVRSTLGSPAPEARKHKRSLNCQWVLKRILPAQRSGCHSQKWPCFITSNFLMCKPSINSPLNASTQVALHLYVLFWSSSKWFWSCLCVHQTCDRGLSFSCLFQAAECWRLTLKRKQERVWTSHEQNWMCPVEGPSKAHFHSTSWVSAGIPQWGNFTKSIPSWHRFTCLQKKVLIVLQERTAGGIILWWLHLLTYLQAKRKEGCIKVIEKHSVSVHLSMKSFVIHDSNSRKDIHVESISHKQKVWSELTKFWGPWVWNSKTWETGMPVEIESLDLSEAPCRNGPKVAAI